MAGEKKKFIKEAIKRPGALTKRVGGAPTENLGKVKELAKSGTPLAKQQANFFLAKLLPQLKKRKGKSLLTK